MNDDTKQRELSHESPDYKVISMILAIVLTVVVVVAGADEILEAGESKDTGNGNGKASTEPKVRYEPEIHPGNYVVRIDNPYLPYKPGNHWVFEVETEDGTETIEVVVLNETREVMGVTCTIVRDTVTLEGVLIEDTFDWYAQDIHGNVWYMGEDVDNYENGVLIDHHGAWEGGVDGALPGIIMMANPLVGMSYYQEYYEDEAEDMGKVVRLNESTTIGYGTFNNVIVTYEWTPIEPDVTAYKYYAPGVGVFQEVEGDEIVELVEFTPA